MKNAEYTWKPGFSAKGLKAGVVAQKLRDLQEAKNGELTAADVLGDAEDKNSPLHRYFDWDDATAAEAYRLAQARRLVASVRVTYRDQDMNAKSGRAFVHVRTEEISHYQDVESAMTHAATRATVLRGALRELDSFRQKYAEYQEFAAIFAAVDEAASVVELTG